MRRPSTAAIPSSCQFGMLLWKVFSCLNRVVSICKCTPEKRYKSASVQDWVFIMTLMTVSFALLHCTTWLWCVVFRFLSLLHAPTNLVGVQVHILIGAMSFAVQYCPKQLFPSIRMTTFLQRNICVVFTWYHSHADEHYRRGRPDVSARVQLCRLFHDPHARTLHFCTLRSRPL